ncbi:histidine phosphatase family protein [Trinickia symbiotica]|uniref:Histidine phosphatase family protein n=2 Tax=Trinickia symbiotica TaxID=863227 RepID=A0A2N7X9S5_9BURK|nr:histidine phosphatase family protein [Trinickia symbiotica]PMS38384.1 histidine phosphatase family protein [Trinickia symbiotica]
MKVHRSLYLIAHAATHAMRVGQFPGDDPLDAHGLARTAAVCNQWPQTSLVLSSPVRCAQQTAAALASEVRIDYALRDVDYGDWRGKPLAELAREMPAALNAWITDPSASPHGGESHEDVLRRVGFWLDQLPLPDDLVAITHSAIIRAAIVHALGAGPKAMSRIEIAPLSVAELRPAPGGWKWMARSYEYRDTA